MPVTTDKKIILTGAPFAWVHKIDNGSITELWKFNNLQSSNYKILKPGSSSQGSDNIDINRADGAIFRFPKTNLILSGIDETDITPADASSDATTKGEIVLVANEAPIESNSWTAFIRDVKANLDSKFLITIGTGYSHKARNDSSLRKPDGFIHMIGKINTDIEQQLNSNPASLSTTFVSYKNSGLDESDLTSITLFTEISWKLGGTGKDVDGLKPPTIIEADAQKLLEGDVVVFNKDKAKGETEAFVKSLPVSFLQDLRECVNDFFYNIGLGQTGYQLMQGEPSGARPAKPKEAERNRAERSETGEAKCYCR